MEKSVSMEVVQLCSLKLIVDIQAIVGIHIVMHSVSIFNPLVKPKCTHFHTLSMCHICRHSSSLLR